jgi:ATP-dependent DNA helicase RecG
MIGLNTPLNEIVGIGSKFTTKLKRLGIGTVRELLWHFPTRYEDFSKIYKIAELIPHQEATIQGTVRKIGSRRTWRRKLFMVEAFVADETGDIRIVWFNQPYIRNVLQPGRLANFSGKVVQSADEIYLSNPTYEVLGASNWEEPKHTARIVPIYPETRGLTSKGFRYLIKPILDDVEELREMIPPEVMEKEELPEINYALNQVHFPNDLDEAMKAKRRFAFEDLFFLQLFNLEQKLKLAGQKATAIAGNLEWLKEVIGQLPFELTASQKRSLWEIIRDMAHDHPMNRLLQGDVGSGKTIVVAIAALSAAKDGHQTAFMAPTEILARQH